MASCLPPSLQPSSISRFLPLPPLLFDRSSNGTKMASFRLQSSQRPSRSYAVAAFAHLFAPFPVRSADDPRSNALHREPGRSGRDGHIRRRYHFHAVARRRSASAGHFPLFCIPSPLSIHISTRGHFFTIRKKKHTRGRSPASPFFG